MSRRKRGEIEIMFDLLKVCYKKERPKNEAFKRSGLTPKTSLNPVRGEHYINALYSAGLLEVRKEVKYGQAVTYIQTSEKGRKLVDDSAPIIEEFKRVLEYVAELKSEEKRKKEEKEQF